MDNLGIIGGADGPTTIFLASDPLYIVSVVLIAAAVLAALIIILRKIRKK